MIGGVSSAPNRTAQGTRGPRDHSSRGSWQTLRPWYLSTQMTPTTTPGARVCPCPHCTDEEPWTETGVRASPRSSVRTACQVPNTEHERWS